MKIFEIGDLVTAPKRNNKYDVAKEYEFAIVTEIRAEMINNFERPWAKVYLQETGSYKDFYFEELKLVHRSKQ